MSRRRWVLKGWLINSINPKGTPFILAARALSALRDPRQVRWLNRALGSLFIGAAVPLAGFKRQA